MRPDTWRQGKCGGEHTSKGVRGWTKGSMKEGREGQTVV